MGTHLKMLTLLPGMQRVLRYSFSQYMSHRWQSGFSLQDRTSRVRGLPEMRVFSFSSLNCPVEGLWFRKHRGVADHPRPRDCDPS